MNALWTALRTKYGMPSTPTPTNSGLPPFGPSVFSGSRLAARPFSAASFQPVITISTDGYASLIKPLLIFSNRAVVLRRITPTVVTSAYNVVKMLSGIMRETVRLILTPATIPVAPSSGG